MNQTMQRSGTNQSGVASGCFGASSEAEKNA
jgi:hypothetical protein